MKIDTFLTQTTCDRCGGSLEGGRCTSMFNTDTICMECKRKEQQRSDYKDAQLADLKAIQSGDYNFAGIGYKEEPDEQ